MTDSPALRATLDVPVFRYLPSRFSQDLMNGNFRIGNANFYRLLEHATDDRHIGDREESAGRDYLAHFSITESELDTAEGERKRAAAEKVGVRFEGRVAGNISNSTMVRYVPCYLLCFSLELQHLSNPANGAPGLDRTYNSYVEYASFIGLAEWIVHFGRLSGHPSIEGKSVGEVFEVGCGFVQYNDDVSFDAYVTSREADPFVKRARYHHQKEARIAFYLKEDFDSLNADHVFVRCGRGFPNAKFTQFGEEVSLDHSVDFDNHIEELLRILFRVQAYDAYRRVLTNIGRSMDRQLREQSMTAVHHAGRSHDAYVKQSAETSKGLGQICSNLRVHYWPLRMRFGGSQEMDFLLERLTCIRFFGPVLAWDATIWEGGYHAEGPFYG